MSIYTLTFVRNVIQNNMRNLSKILIEQLDRKLIPFIEAEKVQIPDRGWIFTLRYTLNMTLEQLGRKLSITRQGAKRIELSEENGGISVNLLRQAGAAMDMKLVYGFVPMDGSLRYLIDRKSRELAQLIVYRTNQTMVLEDQGISKKKLEDAIEDLSDQFKQELTKSLWD